MNSPLPDQLPALLIALPITGALACFILPTPWRNTCGLLWAILTSFLGILAATTVMTNGSIHHLMGGWDAPLGINLHLDGLAAVFILMTSLVGLPVSLYARSFYQPSKSQGTSQLFWPIWLILWGGLNGIFLSADLFNLYVLIEIVTIAAVALAILSGKNAALISGLRYLIAAIAGSMTYLMGVALIYGASGTLDLSLLANTNQNSLAHRTGFALILVGLMVKTALFPLHFWLPGAHSSAQPPVSAILSALVVKASFYLILRLWTEVFEQTLTFAAGQLLGIMGSIAILWGSFQALRQNRLKLIVAHSTVSQIGLLFLLFPLLTVSYDNVTDAPWLAHAWTGGIYQTLAHAFAKASMFLAVGIYAIAIGHDRLTSMTDMVTRLPMTTFALSLAGVSLIGLPPSGGFVAKWMLLKAALASGQWWWAPVVVLGSFMTAGYVFMILRMAFAPRKEHVALQKVPHSMEVAALILGLAAIAIGLRGEELLVLLDIGTPFAEAVNLEEGGPL